jgi:hypothetical protein
MFENLNIDQDILNGICKRVLQRHSKDIEALNKSQLSKGLRSDNTKLPRYSTRYLKTRVKHGRPTSPMDLNLTGDFYKGFFASYFDSYMSISSSDHKEQVLESTYGNIHGLTPESMDTLLWDMGVADEIVSEFIKEIFG